jgi:hypothetical protein
LKFNGTDFEFNDANKNLNQENIKAGSFQSQKIDPNTLHFRFDYVAVYDVPPDDIITDLPNGERVLRWADAWKLPVRGNVYKHDMLEVWAITAPPTAKTVLSITSLTGPSCVEVGSTMTYKYNLTNSGPATSTAFKVKISSEGTEIITHNFATGIGKETKEGTFAYKIIAAGERSITVWADSGNDIDEANENDNSKTVVFTAKSSCNGDGGGGDGGCSLGSACPGVLTGTLKVEYPEIDWKDKNGFEVTLNVPPNACTAVKGRFKVIQGSIEYAYAWTTTISAGNFDAENFKWSNNAYPGNMGEGTVKVIYYVEDSCGRTSIIGPGTFDIVKPPAAAPEVKLNWYSELTNSKIDEAVVDDTVALVATAEDSNNEEVTLSWDFNNSNDWVKGLPATYGWKTPLSKTKYTGIKAVVKGKNNKVCVTGTNESGLSSTACSYLDVLGPEPVAVIDVSGTLKEDRRIRVDGAKSSSPRSLSLTYAWTIAPVAGETAAIHSDIQYILPLTGVKKDFRTPKLGHYNVTLVVTDTLGYQGTTSTIVDVAVDLPPIVNIAGNNMANRQPSDRGLAGFTMLGTAMSVDQDIISKRYWSFTYDANNDGAFNEAVSPEIDEDSLNSGWEYPYNVGSETFTISKSGTHIVTLKGAHVGKYQTHLRVVEIPGQPTDLEY